MTCGRLVRRWEKDGAAIPNGVSTAEILARKVTRQRMRRRILILKRAVKEEGERSKKLGQRKRKQKAKRMRSNGIQELPTQALRNDEKVECEQMYGVSDLFTIVDAGFNGQLYVNNRFASNVEEKFRQQGVELFTTDVKVRVKETSMSQRTSNKLWIPLIFMGRIKLVGGTVASGGRARWVSGVS